MDKSTSTSKNDLTGPSEKGISVFQKFLEEESPEIVSLDDLLSLECKIDLNKEPTYIKISKKETKLKKKFPHVRKMYRRHIRKNWRLPRNTYIFYSHQSFQGIDVSVLMFDEPQKYKFMMSKILEGKKKSYIAHDGIIRCVCANPQYFGISLLEAFEKDLNVIAPKYFPKQ